MTEIPGGDLPICDTCNEPIVGPVIRVGVERFCKKHYQEKTVMPWPKPTIEDFRLKTEGTDTCWIEGCEESQRQRGLCKKHYDKARHNGFLTEVVAQIDARSEPKAPPSKYTSPQAEIAELTVQLLEAQEELSEVRGALVAAIGESQDITPIMEKVATLVRQRDRCAGIAEEAQKALQYAHREAGAEAELRALKDALAEAVGPDLPPLEQISRLVAQYAAQLSRNRELEKALQDAQQEARKQIAAASGEVLLSEEGIRERYARLNEIGHAESLLAGLSEPLQKALRAVLEEQKFRVLRVCP